MPTGYTEAVRSGKVTKFKDFALTCARAFGALIEMRDDPLDAPIPDKLPLYEGSGNQLFKYELELNDWLSMSQELRRAQFDYDTKNAIRYQKERLERCIQERANYESMLEKVRKWKPPSEDHVEMKQFMINQLEESIKFDCHEDSIRETIADVESRTFEDWSKRHEESLRHNIAYYKKQREGDVERNSSRNKWIQQLKASL